MAGVPAVAPSMNCSQMGTRHGRRFLFCRVKSVCRRSLPTRRAVSSACSPQTRHRCNPASLPSCLAAGRPTLWLDAGAELNHLFEHRGHRARSTSGERTSCTSGCASSVARRRNCDAAGSCVGSMRMPSLLEEVIQFGTGIRPKRWAACRRQDGDDAGLHRCLVCGLHAAAYRRRVGRLRRQQISLGKKRNRRPCPLPIWLQFMLGARRNARHGFPECRHA